MSTATRRPPISDALTIGLALAFAGTFVAQRALLLPGMAALLALLLIAGCIVCFHLRTTSTISLRNSPTRPLELLLAVPLSLGLGALLIVAVQRLWPESQFLPDGLSGTSATSLFVYVAVLAPLIEEITFRGWVQSAIARRWGAAVGVLGAGILFGALHLRLHAPQLAIVPLGLGFVWGWTAHRTGSLWSSIALHSGWNAAIFLTL